MDFEQSPRVRELSEALTAFMEANVYPNEPVYREQLESQGTRWQSPAIMADLKAKAKAAGLWNLFLPDSDRGAGLRNLDYAPLCEIMGRSPIAPEIFNCSAPDTGNMETIERFGTEDQKRTWLDPLLAGDIRSAFCMTEPGVASSDATNISCRIVRDGDAYVIDGRKWWSSGLGDPHCKILIVMGKSLEEGPKYGRHSMILVEPDTPGIEIKRMLSIFNYDDAPHGHAEVLFDNVRVPAENMLLGEGRGFEIARGRLGPGRIHHCMRSIGKAEMALELMVKRGATREAFGKPLVKLGKNLEVISRARIEINAMRLAVLQAAKAMDVLGNKEARVYVSAVKAMVPWL
ncbi:MAG TPA: acyl-CoA dehydrogenase, partial [Gammaproteobacteria bacterium]|nr:acyl-CoA dehydrogenase [Gammaproteobacteria bacterium]MCH78670.1 acyl-CoA dehydrogenase [Gammaproteobacteria bacterium]